MKHSFLRMVSILFIAFSVSSIAWAQEPPFPAKERVGKARVGQLVLNQDSLKGYQADFGILVVSESEAKDSRRIELPVVRVRSKSQKPADPVFHFEGGPGLTNIKLDSLPEPLLENHDYVQVGYRGMDGSVSLKLPEINQLFKETPNILSHEGLVTLGGKINQIIEKFQTDQKIDLKQYSFIDVVDDMEKARKALGYKRINLSGYSFGGAIAYAYCVRYPQSIHRVLFTEAAFPFNVGLTKPSVIDAHFNSLNESWKKNPDNLRRSPDIVQTIRNVLKTLPKDWNGVRIDPDRTKLMTWGSLNTGAMTAQCFAAYVSAENGDYSGLVQLSQFWNTIVDVFNWGDMISKTFSTDTGETKDFEAALNPEGSIVGSPLSLLGWGLRQHTNWPVKPLPEAHRKLRKIDTESLLVVGTKDMMASVQRDYMPYFTHGHLVAHENMGHMDLPSLQIEATRYMEKMFFLEGTVDISKFKGSETR